jgi:Flp pilus assembly protein TadD
MDQESNDQKLERAVDLHNAGRLDDAEALYREVLRDAPDHQTALHLSGLIAHQCGRHREAVTLIERALAGGAVTAPIHTNCGVAYRALGEFEQAAHDEVAERAGAAGDQYILVGVGIAGHESGPGWTTTGF